MKYLTKEKELIEETKKEIESIAERQLQKLMKWDPDKKFIELELEICKQLNEIGAMMLEKLIPQIYGDGYIGSRKDIDINSEDPNKRTSYRCENKSKMRHLRTVFGDIKISRAIYSEYFSGGYKSFLDEKLGIENTRICPLIKYWTDLMGTIAPFDESADILNKIRGIKISKAYVERSTEDIGKKIMCDHKSLVENISLDKKGKVPPAQINLNLNAERTVYIETDGCQLNTKNDWKECKTFVLFEIEKVSEDKQVLKNKFYYSTMGDSKELKRHLKYHLEKYCGEDEVRIVCIGDGANWIWNAINELFPKEKYPSGIIEIIDFYHALERIGDVKNTVFSDEKKGNAFFYEYKDHLKKGNLESIEQKLEQLRNNQTDPEKKKFMDEQLGFFMRKKDRMRYEKYRDLGLCIGSGAIESANKYVVQRRVKLQGMKWEEENLNYMVHLRAEYINKKMDSHYGIQNNPLLNQIAVA